MSVCPKDRAAYWANDPKQTYLHETFIPFPCLEGITYNIPYYLFTPTYTLFRFFVCPSIYLTICLFSLIKKSAKKNKIPCNHFRFKSNRARDAYEWVIVTLKRAKNKKIKGTSKTGRQNSKLEKTWICYHCWLKVN